MESLKKAKKSIVFERKTNYKDYFLFFISIPILLLQLLIPLNFLLSIVFLSINIFFLGAFGDILVDSATKSSVKFKLNLFFFGLIFIPLFSSFPEDIITILANLKDSSVGEIILAEIMGNCLFEILIVFGILGFLSCKRGKCIDVKKNERFLVIRNGIIILVGSFLLFFLVFFDHSLTFLDGVVLLFYYILFVSIVFISHKYGETEEYIELPEEANLNPEEINTIKVFMFFIGSILLVTLFGDRFVSNLLFLIDTSENFKTFSFLYIGILIAIPELIVGIIGIREGKTSFVLGSILGGTIWDLLVSVAIQSFVNPLFNISKITIFFLLILLVSAVLMAIIYIRTHWRLKLWESLCLIGVYLFAVFLIILWVLL
jgi:Ca2+/Na+ antiporter